MANQPPLPGMPPARGRRQTAKQRTAAEADIRDARSVGLIDRVPHAIVRALLNTAEDYDQAVADLDQSLFTRARLMDVHLLAQARFYAARGDVGDESLEVEQLRAVRAANGHPPAT